MFATIVLLSLALVAVGAQDASSDQLELGMARIVASKQLLSQYAVQDKEFVVQYNLYNIGDKVNLCR